MPTPDPPLGSGKPEHKLLTEIADEMYATLTQKPGLACHHPLSHGLNIVLQHVDNLWLLKLGRQKVYPSELEITLCKRAFRLADDQHEQRLDPTETGWHVTVIDWSGDPPPPKPLPQPKPRGRRH